MTSPARTARPDPTGTPTRAAVPGFATLDGEQPPAEAAPDFAAIQQSPDFQAVRRRLRRFVFPVSALFFCWYLGYVLLAAYAHDFMSQIVIGHINVGLVLGLLQFVTTIIITVSYVYYMRKDIDPRVDSIRARTGEENA